MSINLTWTDIALRLFLTTLGGAVIGFNRGEHGRPAGIGTMVLVALAAALSMVEANLLLGVSGKTPSSFSVLDLMRFPLGILSGMGFIGAGAIIRRGNLVVGVTTAATLWFATMMGLCFGGGQIGLGLAALGLACTVLWGFKAIEERIPQERKGTVLVSTREPLDRETLDGLIEAHGYKVLSVAVIRKPPRHEIGCMVRWKALPSDSSTPAFLRELSRLDGIIGFEWRPEGGPEEPGLHLEGR